MLANLIHLPGAWHLLRPAWMLANQTPQPGARHLCESKSECWQIASTLLVPGTDEGLLINRPNAGAGWFTAEATCREPLT
jgi:hypothetical protein